MYYHSSPTHKTNVKVRFEQVVLPVVSWYHGNTMGSSVDWPPTQSKTFSRGLPQVSLITFRSSLSPSGLILIFSFSSRWSVIKSPLLSSSLIGKHMKHQIRLSSVKLAEVWAENITHLRAYTLKHPQGALRFFSIRLFFWNEPADVFHLLENLPVSVKAARCFQDMIVSSGTFCDNPQPWFLIVLRLDGDVLLWL